MKTYISVGIGDMVFLDAILTPEFDKKAEAIKDNAQVIDQLNDKIKQVKDGGQ